MGDICFVIIYVVSLILIGTIVYQSSCREMKKKNKELHLSDFSDAELIEELRTRVNYNITVKLQEVILDMEKRK